MRWIAEDRKKTRPNPMGLRLHSLLNYGIVWRQRAALDAGRFFWFFFSLAIMKTGGKVNLWKKELGKIGGEQLVGRMSLALQRIKGLQKMGSEPLGIRRGTKI